MSEMLVKRRVEMCYISGKALKKQRIYAGLTQRSLADLITAATGIEISQQQICRWENDYETAVDSVTAFVIQKILS